MPDQPHKANLLIMKLEITFGNRSAMEHLASPKQLPTELSSIGVVVSPYEGRVARTVLTFTLFKSMQLTWAPLDLFYHISGKK
ncbi:hypothetical protein KIN20_005645 [Parelaphostrongylus tenuis]|uniref:Uncharacterized protein n=1 Tax=Parelaphostrongylus tenuis TaxID=148309 RepID=A0AAD5QKC4_PARTN|nr:hypothetical protein KIN20_005645 [Parelaphostrongylus tenuis]